MSDSYHHYTSLWETLLIYRPMSQWWREKLSGWWLVLSKVTFTNIFHKLFMFVFWSLIIVAYQFPLLSMNSHLLLDNITFCSFFFVKILIQGILGTDFQFQWNNKKYLEQVIRPITFSQLDLPTVKLRKT